MCGRRSLRGACSRNKLILEEKNMDFLSTVKGSLLDNFYPAGWNLKKIDDCCEKGITREAFWDPNFQPVACETLADFDTFLGHEIALQIKKARDEGEKLAIILPVGPMGMYKWAVYFLKEWNVSCSDRKSVV